MTSNKLRAEIHNLLDLLLAADIALYINNCIIQQGKAGGISRVTWGSSRSIPGELFRSEFATVTEYCRWLEVQAYSAILYDAAILQLSYDFRGDQLLGHRLVYYPCPFDVDEELLRTEPVLDAISLYQGRGDSVVHLRTPLRFDCDLLSQVEGHPATHLTLLSSHCRWAVVAPLSLGHFIRFIFRHFYPQLWHAHDFIRTWPQWLGTRTITPEEERGLHITCLR